MTRIAKNIYLIESGPSLRGDAAMRERVEKDAKVKILTGTKVLEISGDKFVTGMLVEREGKREVLDVQGIFIEVGYTPNLDFAAGLVGVNERNEIIVDKHCRTNVDGIFAAGDVTDVPQKQIIVAAGEGAKAALSAYEYLQKLKS